MSQPFYDLCVSTTLLEPQTQRERVSQAIKLGWDAVALVHQAAAKLTEQDRCAIRPVELAALLAAAKGVREALAAAEARAGPRHGDPYTMRQLTRINIPVDDPAAAQAACSSATARGYDLVAVQPGNERLFQMACSTLECDLVSLDLCRRLPYRFKPAVVKAALARGLHFEICLAPALRDAASRRQLFANALALARETRGRGLVLSSGARSYMELRGPLDVINVATLLGLTPQQAAAAVTSAPAAVVARAVARRAYRGTLMLRVRSPEEAAAHAAEEATVREKAQQQQQKQHQQQGGAGSAEAMDVDAGAAAQAAAGAVAAKKSFAQLAGQPQR
ncbi:hypothetical protein ABPG77_009437 [Micractinium sp. CCAP 211/92]